MTATALAIGSMIVHMGFANMIGETCMTVDTAMLLHNTRAASITSGQPPAPDDASALLNEILQRREELSKVYTSAEEYFAERLTETTIYPSLGECENHE